MYVETQKLNEYDLIIAAKQGDNDKFEELLQKHDRFIKSVVRRYSLYYNKSAIYDYNDFLQAAILGFYKAIGNFDCSKGYVFLTYAFYYIRREITRLIPKTMSKANESYFSDCPYSLEDEKSKEEYDSVLLDQLVLSLRSLLKNQEYDVLIYKVAGYKDVEIAKILGCTRQYINKVKRNLERKVQMVSHKYL